MGGNKILTHRQRKYGFEMVEPDDHTIELRRNGKVTARFTLCAAVYAVRKVADAIIREEKKNGNKESCG